MLGRIAMLATVTLFVLYALLAFEYAVAVWRGVTPAWFNLLAVLTSHEFAFGADTGYSDTARLLKHYHEQSLRMAAHMVMGGVVMTLGLTQFIPALRRKHPVLHRRIGVVVGLSMLASTLGAMAYLASTPATETASGPAFHMMLWGLAGNALFPLIQAGLALAKRDFRSHMIWMASCFTAYTAAPLLRVNFLVFAYLVPASITRITVGGATLVPLQANLLMLLWLIRVGDVDLPARGATPTRWPRWLLRVFAVLSMGVALHEGLFAPLGVDLLAAFHARQGVLPGVAALWALATAAAAWDSVAAWDDWMAGRRPHARFVVAFALAGVGALLIGAQLPLQTLPGFGHTFFWFGIGATQLLVLVLALYARPNSLGRNPWGLMALFLLWLPAFVPGQVAGMLLQGLDYAEALSCGLTLSAGAMASTGLATGFGARLRLWPVRVAQRQAGQAPV